MRGLEDIREPLAAIADPLALLEGIFAYAPVGLQIYHSDGRCLLTNRAFRQLFGSEPPPEYNVLEDEIARERGVLDFIHRAFAGETVQLSAIWYDPRDLRQVRVDEGRRVAIESTFFPIFDRGGVVRHVAIVFKDLTAELLALEALEAQRAKAEQAERRARFLAEASSVLVRSTDYETTLREVSRMAIPAFADTCIVDLLEDGVLRRVAKAHVDPTKQLLLERLAREFPPTVDSPQPAMRVLRTGEPELLTDVTEALLAERTFNAAHRDLMRAIGIRSHIAVPLKMRETTLGTLSLGRCENSTAFTPSDVELAVELARRLASAIDIARLLADSRAAAGRAEAAVRARDEFLSIASHELRTPLTALQLQIDNMQTTLVEGGLRVQDFRNRLTRAGRQMRRLASLVDSLLDVSRISNGSLQLDRDSLDLTKVVRDVVERFEDEAQRADRIVEVIAKETIVICGDRMRIEQVVSNLLANALKYGDGKPIEVRVTRSDGWARLIVHDHGIGIGPDDLDRIFERFERAVSPRHYGGLGLGLYIARQIVEAHGGSISAHSEPGVGSTFTVALPTDPA